MRSNSGLSDLKVIFSLQMVNGTSSAFNQHFNVISEIYENGKKRVYHFLAEIDEQQKMSFPHVQVTSIGLGGVTTTALHYGWKEPLLAHAKVPSSAWLPI